MGYTKGPWEYTKKGYVMAGETFIAETCVGVDCAYDIPKNGALIAAAPELLEALKRIVDLQGKLCNQIPLSENELRDWALANCIARDAIEKAEGK